MKDDSPKSLLDAPISVADACRLIGRSAQWLHTLERGGYIKKVGRGRYDAVDVVWGFARSLADDKPKSEAEAKLIAARVEREKQKLDREAHKLITIEESNMAITMISGEAIATFESLPGSIWKARADRALYDELKKWVFDARTRVADRLDEQAASLRESGKAA